MRRALATLLLLPTLGAALQAQGTVASPHAPAGTLQVWLITLGEGEQYWEKYGHNALWFRDSTQGIDVAYNWGMFDFAGPGFLRRQIIGDPQYWVQAESGSALIEAYRRRDRTVVVQRLNLTPAQAERALLLSRTNALDAHKFYRYDYFRDNCSTRVRDMIDAALGGALKRATADTRVPRSYRSETLRLVDDLKLTQFGIDVALGRPADRALTVWENAFVPSRLSETVRAMRVQSAPGATPQPLVAEERVLYQSRSHHERADSPRYWFAYLVLGVLLAIQLVWAGSTRGNSALRDKVFRIEVAVWSLFAGALGLVVLLAWLITDHQFWYYNRNLLLLNPLSLFLVVLAPLSLWAPRFTRPAAIVATLVALSCGLAIIVSAIPALRQDNASLIFLLVPPHLAVASGMIARVRKPGT